MTDKETGMVCQNDNHSMIFNLQSLGSIFQSYFYIVILDISWIDELSNMLKSNGGVTSLPQLGFKTIQLESQSLLAVKRCKQDRMTAGGRGESILVCLIM